MQKFSCFRSFTHDIITQNITHSNMTYLDSDHSASTSLGKGEGVDKESNEKWHRKEGCSQKSVVFHTNSCIYFFCNSIFISSWFLMKKELTCVSEMTILYLHKNIIITLLCRSGLFINTCVSKNPVVFKDVIFYLLWYTWYAEAVIYAKNLLFFNSIVS